ncbi:MAG: PhoH family protein [Myxococcota bacterium]|nr:PhoH family protein [Myxococcota bacterium]
MNDKPRKNFVLDTNVLLHDPNSIHRFGKNNVIIPIYVIEEVDTFKRQLNELGRAARLISRHLDNYRSRGNLGAGVEMENGGLLRVAVLKRPLPKEANIGHQADNMIMAVALELRQDEPEHPCIFVTMDTNLRIRADTMGLAAENYEANLVSLDELYPGTAELFVAPNVVDALHHQGEAAMGFEPHPTDSLAFLAAADAHLPVEERVLHYRNEYVLLRDVNNESHTAIGRIVPTENRIVALRKLTNNSCWGIKPRNMEQHFCFDSLLDDNIQLVTLLGKAGTGKTLLALAAGLQKAAEEEKFTKLLVARPVFPLGRDIGFLPGSVGEKLNPWMQPIFDNIELLMGLTQSDRRSGRSAQELIDLGILQIEALTYIRGRSIPNQYIIIDESQNLTPHEVKTIITRVGTGTKIVFTGDPYQIDNPYVDAESNGLSYLVNKLKGHDICSTVTLRKGERSKLAELAANVL